MPRKPDWVVEGHRFPSWTAVAFDISLSGIASASIQHDAVTGKTKGPKLHMTRWPADTDYFEILKQLSNAQNFVEIAVPGWATAAMATKAIRIAVEEPFAFRNKYSNQLKQQGQLTGAFLGGLARVGYGAIIEVNNQSWKAHVGRQIGVAIRGDTAKWLVKEWALDKFKVPELTDLIVRDGRKIPRPENSRAKAAQPADEYDALGQLDWLIADQGLKPFPW